MTDQQMKYEEKCRAAATDQGLDPLTEALRERDIKHGVAQTGGFCMAVVVPVKTGTWAIVNDGTWVLGFFEGDGWNHYGEPDREVEVESVDEVLTVIAE